MCKICEVVANCLKETNKAVYADLKFCGAVKIVTTDPFKRLSDYRRECEGLRGVIFAGYGGGNVTIDSRTDHNLIPLIKELVGSDVPVILTSQVPLGPADYIYKNGYDAIAAGAISGVDLSLPECQVRASYLLGHENDIKRMAEKCNRSFMEAFEWLFMSGTKFRTSKSRRMYETLRKTEFPKDDLLINVTFDDTLEKF
jgi:L-asparaginase/Glu-tRNA(Gln) amidotransferase subunit D